MNAPDKLTVLEALAGELLAAKRAEEAAKAKRLEIEALLCEELRGPDEGTVSEKAGAYKISVAYKMNRTVDTPALQSAWPKLPAFVQAAFTWKADCSIALLRKLQDDQPGLYAEAARFITVKPAKPAVKCEVL